MPADRYQKSIKRIEASYRKGPLFPKGKKLYESWAPPPNKSVVTNVATGKPELWDIPSWSKKWVMELIPPQKYQGPSWNPNAPFPHIPVQHTKEERHQLLEQRYEEFDHLREQAELVRAERAHAQRLEGQAEQAYLDKVVGNYPGYHPMPPTPGPLLNRVLLEESAARIAKMVRIEPEWVKDHFHLLPEDTVCDRICITWKKYQYALRLLPILEEMECILVSLHNIIFEDYKFSAEKESQLVVEQV
ncbi:hypothetical protein WOLCODRAFT_17416 [Wolfiporia cocos MD-104 SS10]|uniref:Uncharacterized protein n=1 Tax=Wolfiporia cocos (strain MD-104) TaxID=742152 RepID=A0A2H3JZ04_WOLCO|nr:hypothetical protein WOLCODRAFT_17416 [Wolfiporia cocos MD-104 SS10]